MIKSNIFLLYIALMMQGCWSPSNEIVDYKTIGSCSEYFVLSERGGIIVWSKDYTEDSSRMITSYKITQSDTEQCYYLTYYLNNLFENKPDVISYFSDATIAVMINIPHFNKEYSVYYKDSFGTYKIREGDFNSWAANKNKLRTDQNQIYEYINQKEIGIYSAQKQGTK